MAWGRCGNIASVPSCSIVTTRPKSLAACLSHSSSQTKTSAKATSQTSFTPAAVSCTAGSSLFPTGCPTTPQRSPRCRSTKYWPRWNRPGPVENSVNAVITGVDFATLLRNTFCRSETETQGGGLSSQPQEMAIAGAFFHRSEDTFLVGLAHGDKMEENSGKFVGSGSDGCGSPEPTSQAAEVMPQVRLAAVKRLCSHAESHGEAIRCLQFSR